MAADFTKVNLRSDMEASIVALKTQVAVEMRKAGVEDSGFDGSVCFTRKKKKHREERGRWTHSLGKKIWPSLWSSSCAIQ